MVPADGRQNILHAGQGFEHLGADDRVGTKMFKLLIVSLPGWLIIDESSRTCRCLQQPSVTGACDRTSIPAERQAAESSIDPDPVAVACGVFVMHLERLDQHLDRLAEAPLKIMA